MCFSYGPGRLACTCQRRLKIPHFAGRKFPSPHRVVVYSFGCRIQNEFQPVKRRRALVETNLPRNSWPQTHQDDEARGGADDDLAPGSEQYIGLIDLPMPKKTHNEW